MPSTKISGRVGLLDDPEPKFPWSRTDHRVRVLRAVRDRAPQLLLDLETLCASPDADVGHGVTAIAKAWHLEKPWLIKTRRRTVDWWRRSPKLRANRQWAAVIPENGWGHPRGPSRRAKQYRGVGASPTSKIQDTAVFVWWVRYQVLEETYRAIAGSSVEWTAVRLAIIRLATDLDLPLRPGRRGRPRKTAT